MNTYRLFEMDARGAIHRPPAVLEAVDDDEAILESERVHNENFLELWRGSVRVAKWGPDGRVS